jgi:hypothetical protein
VGDQVYVDPTAGLYDPTAKEDRYRLPYEAWLRQKNVRDVLRRIPSFMLLDDHEIDDNWEAATGDDYAFARDLQVCLHYLLNANERSHVGDFLPGAIRCALGSSSIASLGHHTPVELAIRAASVGVISTSKPFDIAKLQGPANFVRAADELAHTLPPDIGRFEIATARSVVPEIPLAGDQVKEALERNKNFPIP